MQQQNASEGGWWEPGAHQIQHVHTGRGRGHGRGDRQGHPGHRGQGQGRGFGRGFGRGRGRGPAPAADETSAGQHIACAHGRPGVGVAAKAGSKRMPLSPEVPLGSCLEAVYDEQAAKRLPNTHLGQRKLLLSEVQLLTEHYLGEKKKKKGKNPDSNAGAGDRHPLLVYVGAAPGTHDAFLSDLFPHVKFVLYDGARFDPALYEHRSAATGERPFELHNEFFTDDTCRSLLERLPVGKPLLFVSDIRSDGEEGKSFEQQVMWDLLSQRRWVELLRPALSMLKFRLPFTLQPGDAVPYLRGKLLFGIWPPASSAETRLLVRRADLAQPDASYDYEAYERTLYFHNRYTRTSCFSDALPDSLRALLSPLAPLPLPLPAAEDASPPPRPPTAPPRPPAASTPAEEVAVAAPAPAKKAVKAEKVATPLKKKGATKATAGSDAHVVGGEGGGDGEGSRGIPQYCGCYDCAAELMVYQQYVEVAAAAGRPDLADVASVVAAYARHARATSTRLPTLAPPRGQAGDGKAGVDAEVAAAVKACRAGRARKIGGGVA